MKIGIDLSFIRPDHKNGGTEAVIKNLIKGFEEVKKQEELPQMVYFVHRDIYKDYKKAFPNLCYRVYDAKQPHAIRTILFQTFRLPRLVKAENLDLLYFPTFQTGLKRRWKLPLIVNPHDIQYKYYPEYFSSFKRLYFQLFYGNALRKADRVIAISRYVEGSYTKHFPKLTQGKMRLIYDPIDFAGQSEEPVEAVRDFEGAYILCINSLTKHKNLITLVKAFDRLSRKHPDLKLVIGGAKWNGANEIADYISRHSLEKSVILTGRLNDGQLQYLYKHASLFVTPSLYEGFGMTPVEAMAAQCPVISSKETSLYEVTGGLVRYYEPAADEKMLCRAMEEELENPVSETILQKRRDEIFRYSKEKIAKQYLQLFYETVGVEESLKKEDRELYGRLFDSAAARLAANDIQLACSRESFQAVVQSAPQKINAAPLLKLQGKELADALWLACFHKLPDAAFRERQKESSQKKLLNEAAAQGSFALRRLKLVQCPFAVKEHKIKSRAFALAAGIKNSVFLRKLAKKLPGGMQKKIRRLFA